jgi:hypothetical protein
MADNSTIPERRELSPAERRLLEWLLANGTPEASFYVAQLPLLKVVSRCACGCPSIDLVAGGKGSRTIGASTIIADAMGRSPEGALVGVSVHVREGEISELEVYSPDGEAEVFTLPKPEMLKAI